MIPETYATASELVSSLRTGQTSSRELLEQFVERFERLNTTFGAVIKHDLTAARARADALDRRWKHGQIMGPLHGLPITVKDTFDVFGMPAASGSASLAKRDLNTPDSLLVSRLVSAGAIIWGKTNTPFMAGDVQTYNKLFGVTKNPYNPERTSGGSSGGAAAALALGLTPLEPALTWEAALETLRIFVVFARSNQVLAGCPWTDMFRIWNWQWQY